MEAWDMMFIFLKKIDNGVLTWRISVERPVRRVSEAGMLPARKFACTCKWSTVSNLSATPHIYLLMQSRKVRECDLNGLSRQLISTYIEIDVRQLKKISQHGRYGSIQAIRLHAHT
jgi:hypothetical protein